MKKRLLCLLLAALTLWGLSVPAMASGEPDIVPAAEEPAAPETTAEPEITEEPGTTAEPEETAEPETTAEPEETVVPETTAEPEAAEEPETTAGPETTAEPEPNDDASAEPADEAETAAYLEGLVVENGKTYYYVDGEKQTGFQYADGAMRYFDPKDGHMMKGGTIKVDRILYYLDDQGRVAESGWVTARSGKKYFASFMGALLTGGPYDIDGKEYYFSTKDGHLMKGGVVNAGYALFYLNGTDGHVMKGGWVNAPDGKKYYASETGELCTTRRITASKRYFFSSKDGHLEKTISGKTVLNNAIKVKRLNQGKRGTCAATAFSMAANMILGYDKYGAYDWTYSSTNDNINLNGYIAFKGTDGHTYRPVWGPAGYGASGLARAIDNALSKGYPIVVSVKGTRTAGTHYVLVVDWANSEHTDYLIVDPSGTNGTTMAEAALAMRGEKGYELGNKTGTYVCIDFVRS